MFGDAAGCPGDAGNADCKLSGAQQPWGGKGGWGWVGRSLLPFCVSRPTAGALANL